MTPRPDNEESLVALLTRGFSGIHDQLRERDEKVGQLSDKMIGVEFKIDQLNKTLVKVETDIARAETENIKNRVSNLENANRKLEDKAVSDLNWRRGLLASIIMLLIGFVLNFIRISLK